MEQDLQSGLEGIRKKIGDVDVKVSGVLSLLKGNELDKDDRGILGEVSDHNVRITSLEKFKDKIVYIVIGMGLPAGVGIWEFVRALITRKP